MQPSEREFHLGLDTPPARCGSQRPSPWRNPTAQSCRRPARRRPRAPGSHPCARRRVTRRALRIPWRARSRYAWPLSREHTLTFFGAPIDASAKRRSTAPSRSSSASTAPEPDRSTNPSSRRFSRSARMFEALPLQTGQQFAEVTAVAEHQVADDDQAPALPQRLDSQKLIAQSQRYVHAHLKTNCNIKSVELLQPTA